MTDCKHRFEKQVAYHGYPLVTECPKCRDEEFAKAEDERDAWQASFRECLTQAVNFEAERNELQHIYDAALYIIMEEYSMSRDEAHKWAVEEAFKGVEK